MRRVSLAKNCQAIRREHKEIMLELLQIESTESQISRLGLIGMSGPISICTENKGKFLKKIVRILILNLKPKETNKNRRDILIDARQHNKEHKRIFSHFLCVTQKTANNGKISIEQHKDKHRKQRREKN